MKHNVTLQRAAGRVAWDFFEELNATIRPGVNILEIEQLAQKRIEKAKMKPAFLGYRSYPAATCISVNSAIVHGIPTDELLQEGDVVAVDIGINNQGYLVDTARTYGVGQISSQDTNLIEVTALALENVIPLCRNGVMTGDIGSFIQNQVKEAGFSVVKELTGHGVGETLQEEPSVPNYGKAGQGKRLSAGTVIAIEPITTIRPVKVVVMADGWTIAATDDTTSAHFEHTLLITDGDPIVFTKPE